MPNYRRRYGEGGTFAFTVCLADRSATTLTDEIDVLRDAYRATRAARPFRTDALCILPDHLHALWTLPEGDTDYPGRWRSFKRRVTNALGRPVWQPRYWEHTIRGRDDHANHANYIHSNPVKHGLVRDMDDWPHSTWHRWKAGVGAAWAPPPGGMRMAQGAPRITYPRSPAPWHLALTERHGGQGGPILVLAARGGFGLPPARGGASVTGEGAPSGLPPSAAAVMRDGCARQALAVPGRRRRVARGQRCGTRTAPSHSTQSIPPARRAARDPPRTTPGPRRRSP